jgi:V/A-type H+-transporting ATPase subunit I
MSIVKMKKLKLVLAQEDQIDLLNYLQERGLAHIEDNGDLDELLQELRISPVYDHDRIALQDNKAYVSRMGVLRKPHRSGESALYSEAALEDLIQQSLTWQQRITEVLKVLKPYDETKKPLFTVKRETSLQDRYMEEEDQLKLLTLVEDIEGNQVDHRQALEEEARLMAQLHAIEDWKDLALPEMLDNTNYHSTFGYFGSRDEYEQFFAAVAEADVPLAGEICFEQEGNLAVILVWPFHSDAEAKDLINRSHLIRFPATNKWEEIGDFRKSYKVTQSRIQAVQDKAEWTEKEFKNYADHIPVLQLLYDVLEADIAKLRAILNLTQTRHLTILTCYVPAHLTDALKEQVETRFNALVLAEDPVEGEDLPPTLLDNHSLNQPIESTILTFSPPHYYEDTDPTWVMMWTYAFFFGSMLSDVGYGLLLVIGTLLGLYKFKAEGNLKSMLQVFMVGGLFSIGFGILYGSFFGGVLGTMSHDAFDLPVLWFNPMDKPIDLMMWSMVFGVFHLFLAMGIDVYNKFRKGNRYDALFVVAPWYLIIGGIILMLIGVSWAKYVSIAGAAVLILMSVRSKNPFKRILGGLLNLYDVTSWLSDILSYTRILALTLATSVIAMVVNLMADMIGLKGPQAIFTILVLIAGHALNLALSTLSAYVHSTRLHYVEFFGKFYEGGGRNYTPLQLDGLYTKVTDNADSVLTKDKDKVKAEASSRVLS